ncbi:AAA ATPase [Aureococcus anophagefferens]|nr:AAA ATPase [Aureococcus anophagefferens]
MAPARRGSRGSASTAGRSSTGRKSVAAARPRRSAGNYDNDDDDDDDDDEEEEAPVALRRPRRGSAMEADDDDDDDDDDESRRENPATARPGSSRARRRRRGRRRRRRRRAAGRAPKPRALMNVTGDTPNNGLGAAPRAQARAEPQSPTSGGRYKADSRRRRSGGRRRENLELPTYGMDSPERGGRDRRDRGRRRRSAPRRANPYFSTSDSSVEPRSKSDRKKDRLFSSAPVGEDSSSDDDDDDDDARPRGPPPAPKPFVGVAGLEAHLKSLEEMVLLPLKHPNLYASLGVAPPRGVLFHGPPGTGKTLLARQLAEACSAELVAQRKAGDKAAKKAHPGGVSFFVRNGADCLSKYVGEAERALSALGGAREGAVDHLLRRARRPRARAGQRPRRRRRRARPALRRRDAPRFDGRLERPRRRRRHRRDEPAGRVDPALRRPGRFDRELKFVAPDAAQREAILALPRRPGRPRRGAAPTEGARGAAAAWRGPQGALRRGGARGVAPRAAGLYARGADAAAPAAPPVVAPGDFDAADVAAPAAFGAAAPTPRASCPRPCRATASPSSARRRGGRRAVAGGSGAAAAAPATAFGYAVAAHAPCRGAAAFARPRAVVLSAANLRDRDVVAAAVLFLPDVDEWWAHALPQTKVALRALLLEAREDQALLVVATTAGGALDDDDVAAPDALAAAAEVAVPAPSKKAREAFWALGLGEVAAAFRAGLEAARLPAEEPAEDDEDKAPSEADESPAPSPAAPREPGEKEAHCLRELRVFLRAALRELKADRSLQALWRPVDPEESPEYFAVVQSPMDLSVVRAKVDGGLYPTLRHFLSDVRVVRESAAARRRTRARSSALNALFDALDDGEDDDSPSRPAPPRTPRPASPRPRPRSAADPKKNKKIQERTPPKGPRPCA